MSMNPQHDSFLSDKKRLGGLGFLKSDKDKSRPAETPRDESEDGHEHGPITEVHMKHDHDMGTHHVEIVHADGHKRHSEYDSVQEAMDHVSAAHEPSEHSDEDEYEAPAPAVKPLKKY